MAPNNHHFSPEIPALQTFKARNERAHRQQSPAMNVDPLYN
jgi:hypothetical protein